VKKVLSTIILSIFAYSCTISPIDGDNSSVKTFKKDFLTSGSAESNYKNAIKLINEGDKSQGINILQEVVDNNPEYTPAKIMLDRMESPFSLSASMVEKYIEDWINAPSSVPAFTMKKPEVPEVPERPVLTKGEFESNQQFKSRIYKAKIKYKAKVEALKASYKKSIDGYNNAVDRYNSKIDWERKSRIEKIPAMRKRYLDIAFTEVLGSPSLQNLNYNADKEVFYGQITSEYSNFKLNVEIPVILSKAKEFKNNVKNIKPALKIDFVDGNIIFSKVSVTNKGVTYNAKLLNSDENIKPASLATIESSVTVGDEVVVIEDISVEKIKPLKVKQIIKANRQFFIPKI
jgi:hypothetical protein